MPEQGISRDRRRRAAETLLALAISAVAAVVAATGAFSGGGEGTRTVTSIRGDDVVLYGRGLYAHDTLFVAGGQRGTDVVVLAIAVPALIVTTLWRRRGSLRGALLQAGVLAYLLYVYGSAALGTVAYNDLFLAYVALFTGTACALALAVAAIDPAGMARQLDERFPWRWPARYLVAAAMGTAFIWLEGPLTALLTGDPPARLDTYATPVTTALDVALIVPLALVAAARMWRRDPRGILMTVPLLGIIVLLGPTFVAQTIGQVQAGVAFSRGEMIGPIAGFGTMALLATWVLVAMVRGVHDRLPAAGVSTAPEDQSRKVVHIPVRG